MKNLKTAIITLILCYFHSLAFSAENGFNGNENDIRYDREILLQARDNFIKENGDLIIKGLTIAGLEKTRSGVVINESEINEGDSLSSFDPHRFINRLKKKNLFTDISISYKKDSEEVLIELTLHEKWTIIPLPMFYSNGNTTTYGIFIIESNLLGYGKSLFTGFTYSEKSKSAMLGYVDPSINWTNAAGSLFLIYKDSIIQNGTMDEKIFQEYKLSQTTVRIDGGYSFSNSFKFLLSGGYQNGILDYDYSGSINPPESQKFYLAGGVIKFDFISYYEYFFFGLKGEIHGYTHIPVDNEKQYNTIDYKIDYSHKIFNYHRITLFSSGAAGNKPDVLEERISGRTGTRTLPADIISADNYANYSIVYEYPFARFNKGAITLLGFWEQGVYNKDHSSYNSYYGPGGGILFYLKRVAFPAVGFNYAKNLKTDHNEFSVNVGLNF